MKEAFRGASLAFLLVGAGLGFAGVYLGIHHRATELVKPLPKLKPRSETATEPDKPPPLDTARLQQLEETVKVDPKNTKALTELGNMQADQRNYNEAIQWYQQAVNADPRNIELRNYLGEAQFEANRIDDALATFQAALQMNPSNPEALFDYGYVLLQGKNDPEGAIRSWEKLVQDNPKFDQLDRVKQLIATVKERIK